MNQGDYGIPIERQKEIEMSNLKQRRGLRSAYEKIRKMSPPGAGGRFKAIEKIAAAGGAKKPGAVAAAIGIKKYGKGKMTKMAAAGRKKK